METPSNPNIVDAIYELRSAVETKAQAEQELAVTNSDGARDALLAAQLDVEAKTQDAIEVCHECGECHAEGGSHPAVNARVESRHDNVVHVDFRPAGDHAQPGEPA